MNEGPWLVNKNVNRKTRFTYFKAISLFQGVYKIIGYFYLLYGSFS